MDTDEPSRHNDELIDGPPAKRPRLSPITKSVGKVIHSLDMPEVWELQSKNATDLLVAHSEAAKEALVGITAFVRPDGPRFSGLLKKRYTDFLVNEILPSGRVLHLQDVKVPKAAREEKSGIGDERTEKPTESQPSVNEVSTQPGQKSTLNGNSATVAEASGTTVVQCLSQYVISLMVSRSHQRTRLCL